MCLAAAAAGTVQADQGSGGGSKTSHRPRLLSPVPTDRDRFTMNRIQKRARGMGRHAVCRQPTGMWGQRILVLTLQGRGTAPKRRVGRIRTRSGAARVHTHAGGVAMA